MRPFRSALIPAALVRRRQLAALLCATIKSGPGVPKMETRSACSLEESPNLS
jgi:hypothetical protein